MLNAFRHRRNFHTRHSPTYQVFLYCAQRLSASTKLSLLPLGECFGFSWRVLNAQLSASTKLSRSFQTALPKHSQYQRSTPFGIDETFTRGDGPLHGWIDRCSTPFGIDETFTWKVFQQCPPAAWMCSTPFGIDETFTPTTSAQETSRRRRAQRLSASTKLSLEEPDHRELRFFMCSTRLSASTKLSHCDVQRGNIVVTEKCSTPFGIDETFTHRRPGSNACRVCAQRLSASTKLSHGLIASGLRSSILCSTPFGIDETFTIGWLAPPPESKRAQRLSASTKLSPGPGDPCRRAPDLCSTPFGIDETFTRDQMLALKRRLDTCSTPFGIDETFTPINTVTLHTIPGAQRLSASTKLSLPSRPRPGRQARSCSTPFGIDETFTARSRTSPDARSCAQRLSASTKLSPASTDCGPCRSLVLNAFRHRRNFH